MDDPIWHCVGSGFGDLWASLSWCLRRSLANNKPVQMSFWSGTNGRHNDRDRLLEMLHEMNVGACRVSLVDSLDSTCIGYECWGAEYLPTRIRWQDHTHAPCTLAYQLDGVSSAHLKNPSEKDILDFTAWAQVQGLTLIPIGKPSTIRECALAIATAESFVGVCSGMSVLALSVGAPVQVVEYGLKAEYWYGPNQPTYAPDLAAFMNAYEKRAIPA